MGPPWDAKYRHRNLLTLLLSPSAGDQEVKRANERYGENPPGEMDRRENQEDQRDHCQRYWAQSGNL